MESLEPNVENLNRKGKRQMELKMKSFAKSVNKSIAKNRKKKLKKEKKMQIIFEQTKDVLK